MNIKPIPTEYKGVLFRSRLEARWALFFDALNIAWEYEAEAFALRDGTGYLPDFWLPKFEGGIYAEVKPLGGKSEKAEAFARENGSQVWLCDGEPGFRVTTLIASRGKCCAGCSKRESRDGGVIRCSGDEIPAAEWFKTARECDRFEDERLWFIPVIPLADQAEGESRLYWQPGYQDEEGNFDPRYAGKTFSRAVAAVRAHRFWNPTEAR